MYSLDVYIMTADSAKKIDTSPVNPLTRLSEALQDDMTAVNNVIMSKMHSDVALIPQLASHLIAAGGKRLRPLLTIATAKLCGYEDGTRHHDLAACVEFIHTATLLHDDVVDESDQRRGQDSANTIFGNEAAVLVGDFLFSRAFQLMVKDGSLDVLRILSNASAVIAEGEVMQLSTANNMNTTYDQYIKVITAKTAALFAAACEVGGVVAGRDDETCQALYDYGLNLGIAFQIADDVLDYKADAETLGKSIGDDFKEGKMTLPVIYALESATDDERAFWTDVIVNGQASPENLKQAIDICTKYNCFNKSLTDAETYKNKAIQALKILPEHPIKTLLLETADYVLNRSV